MNSPSSEGEAYFERLSSHEVRRMEEVLDISYLLEPSEPFKSRNYAPDLVFTAREACLFLGEALYRRGFIVQDCRITGGAARYILESFSFSDIDISYYLDQGNVDFFSIKECVIDFLLYKLSWPSSFRDQAQEAYLYKKRIFSDNGDLSSYLGIGGIDLKFIYRKKRQSVSSSDGFQVSYYYKTIFCFEGEKLCNKREFVLARKALRRYQFPIKNPELVFRLILRLVHSITCGFNIEDRKELASLAFRSCDIHSGNITEVFKRHIQSHYPKTPEGKVFSFLNFCRLISEGVEEDSYRVDYWKKLALSIKDDKRIERFAYIMEEYPRLFPSIQALAEGLFLRNFLLGDSNVFLYRFSFMPFEELLRFQMIFSIKKRNFSLLLSDYPAGIAINLIREIKFLGEELGPVLFGALLSFFINLYNLRPLHFETECAQSYLSRFFWEAFRESPMLFASMKIFSQEEVLLSFLSEEKILRGKEVDRRLSVIQLLSQSRDPSLLGKDSFKGVLEQMSKCICSDREELKSNLFLLNVRAKEVLRKGNVVLEEPLDSLPIHRAWRLLGDKSCGNIHSNEILETLHLLFFLMISRSFFTDIRLEEKDYRILHRIWKNFYQIKPKRAKNWIAHIEPHMKSDRDKKFCQKLYQRHVIGDLNKGVKAKDWEKTAVFFLDRNRREFPNYFAKKKRKLLYRTFEELLRKKSSKFARKLSESLLVFFSEDFSLDKNKSLSRYWFDLIQEFMKQGREEEVLRMLLERFSTFSHSSLEALRPSLFKRLCSQLLRDKKRDLHSFLQILKSYPQDFIKTPTLIPLELKSSFEEALFYVLKDLSDKGSLFQAKRLLSYAEQEAEGFPYISFWLYLHEGINFSLNSFEDLYTDRKFLMKYGVGSKNISFYCESVLKEMLLHYFELSRKEREKIPVYLNVWKGLLLEEDSSWKSIHHSYRDLFLEEFVFRGTYKSLQFAKEELFLEDKKTRLRIIRMMEINLDRERMETVLDLLLFARPYEIFQSFEGKKESIFLRFNDLLNKESLKIASEELILSKYVLLAEEEISFFLSIKNTPWKRIMAYKIEKSSSFGETLIFLESIRKSFLRNGNFEELALFWNLFFKNYRGESVRLWKKIIIRLIKVKESVEKSLFLKIFSKNVSSRSRYKGLKYLQRYLAKISSCEGESKEEIFQEAYRIQNYFRERPIPEMGYRDYLRSEAILLESLSFSRNRRIQNSSLVCFRKLKRDFKEKLDAMEFSALEFSVKKMSPPWTSNLCKNFLGVIIPCIISYTFMTCFCFLFKDFKEV